jgi:hypothetical protein
MIHRKQLTARRFTAGQFTGGAIHRKQLTAGRFTAGQFTRGKFTANNSPQKIQQGQFAKAFS